ncbi:MAG: diaminopimelate decarboxylase, partial [Atopobium sp.]|nr:diaminopimelate decarboxylase [Atopobium sp.]
MSKKPFVSADALEAIAKTYPTPFHLYNKAEIVRRAKLLQEAFSWNAGFKEYFAVKATPNPYIVRLLAE